MAVCAATQSTLMRAIANGQVDGFPPKEELRTVYVEHDIDAELSDISVVDYVFADPVLKGEVTLPQVTETLGSVGFTENMQNSPVASLSGGWKMKLALGKSSLQQHSLVCYSGHPYKCIVADDASVCPVLIHLWVDVCVFSLSGVPC